MPKLTKSVPKYRLHKGSGRAVVTIAGRDHYLGKHGTPESKSEYDRLVGEWMTAGRPPVAVPENDVLVADVLVAYLRHARTYYVKNGEPTNEIDAMRLVASDARSLYGNSRAIDFGPIALKTVRQIWIDRGRARPTVNKHTRRLTRIFRWAVAEELIPGSVIHALASVPGLKRGRCSLPEPDPIMPVDMGVVLATIEHLPKITADMVRFQLLTGARPGEVCRMRPSDIDRTRDVWEYHDADHKTVHHGKKRVVYIGYEAQSILEPYMFRKSDLVCFSMAESLEQRRRLLNSRRVTPASCGNRRGKRSQAEEKGPKGIKKRSSQTAFNPSSYRHAIHNACKLAFDAPAPLGKRPGESDAARVRRLTLEQRAALRIWRKEKQWHPNQLRHTRGTDIRRQFGLEAAQVILGHSAADVTQIYAERDAEKAREVARLSG